MDGTVYTLTNPEPTAREILALIKKDPANYVLIFTAPGEEKRTLALDDNVDLRQLGIEEFTFASTLRQFIIYIDETQVVFAKPEPTGNELLHAVSKPPSLYAVTQILPGVDDQFIDPDEKVDLRRAGVERFTTVLKDDIKHKITIIVNGRQKTVTAKQLSFAEVVALAFDRVPTGSNTVFTVTYRKGEGYKPEGTLVAEETVRIKDGMIFNVTATDKS